MNLSPSLQLHDKVMHLSCAVADAENLQPTNSRKLQILVSIEALLPIVPRSEILLVQRKLEELLLHSLLQSPPFLLKRVIGRVMSANFSHGDPNGVHAFANTMIHKMIGNASDVVVVAGELRVVATVIGNFPALTHLVPELLEIAGRLARSPDPAIREESLKICTEIFLGSRVPHCDIYKSIIAKIIQSDRSPQVRLAAATCLHTYIKNVNPNYAFMYMEIFVNLCIKTLFIDSSGYSSVSLVQAKHVFTDLLVSCLAAFGNPTAEVLAKAPLGVTSLDGAVALLVGLAGKHKDNVDTVVCALVRLSEKAASAVTRALVSEEIAGMSAHAAGWGARAVLRSQPSLDQVGSLFREHFLPLLQGSGSRPQLEVALEASLELGALLGGGALRVIDPETVLSLRELRALGVYQTLRMCARLGTLKTTTQMVHALVREVAEAGDVGGRVGASVEALGALVAELGSRVSMDMLDAVLSLAEKLVTTEDEERRRLGYVLVGALMSAGSEVLGSKLTVLFHLWKQVLGRNSIASVNKIRPMKTSGLYTILTAVQSLHAFISEAAGSLLKGEESPQPRLVRVVLLLLGNVYQLVQTLVPSAIEASVDSTIDLCLALRGEVLACFSLIDKSILLETYIPLVADPQKQFSLASTLLRSCTLDVLHAEGNFRSSTAFLTRVLAPVSETVCVLADLADNAGDAADGKETGDANVQFHLHALGKNQPSPEYFRSALGPMVRRRPTGRSVDVPWRAHVDVFEPLTEQQESAEWLWRSSTVSLLADLLPSSSESLTSLTTKYNELIKSARRECSIDLLMIGCTLLVYLRKPGVPVPEGFGITTHSNSPLARRLHAEIVGLVSSRASVASVASSAGSALAAFSLAAEIRAESPSREALVAQLGRLLKEEPQVRESVLVALASVAHLVPQATLQECGKLLVAHLFADIYEANVVLVALARIFSVLVRDPSQAHLGFEVFLSELASLARTSQMSATHTDILRSCLRSNSVQMAVVWLKSTNATLYADALDSITHSLANFAFTKEHVQRLLWVSDRFPKLQAKIEFIVKSAPIELLVALISDRSGALGVRAQEVLTRAVGKAVSTRADDEIFQFLESLVPTLVRLATTGVDSLLSVSVQVLEALVDRFAHLQADDEPWLRRYEAELLTTLRLAFAGDFDAVTSAVRISGMLLTRGVAEETREIEDLICDFRFFEGERRAEKTLSLIQRLHVMTFTNQSSRLIEKTVDCAVDLCLLFERRSLNLTDNLEIFYAFSVADVANLKKQLTSDLLTAVLVGLGLWLKAATDSDELISHFHARTFSKAELLVLYTGLVHFAVREAVDGCVFGINVLLELCPTDAATVDDLVHAVLPLVVEKKVRCPASDADAFLRACADKEILSDESFFLFASTTSASSRPWAFEYLCGRGWFAKYPASVDRLQFPLTTPTKEILAEFKRLIDCVDESTAACLANSACSRLRSSGNLGFMGLLVILGPRITDERVLANIALTLVDSASKNAQAALATATKILDSANFAILATAVGDLVGEQTGLTDLVDKLSEFSEGVVDWVLARAVDCPYESRRVIGEELAVVAAGPLKPKFVEALGALTATDRSSVETILREKVANERHQSASTTSGIQLKLAF